MVFSSPRNKRRSRKFSGQGMLEYVMLMGMITILAVGALKPARAGLLSFYLEQRGGLVFQNANGAGASALFVYFNMY